jgi:hypothetical protein
MIEDINRLFLNQMQENKFRHPNVSKEGDDICEIEYKTNSLGYRDKEFDGKSDILALGCSMTYGQGLPQENIWIDVLSKKLNISFSNLASRGDSTIGQIIKAFYYFQKFGNPKIVVALFPCFRIPTPQVKDKMESVNNFRQKQFKYNNYMPKIEYTEIDDSRFIKYSKAPHDPANIISEDFVFFYEKIFIDMLRQYCKSNGIKFFWTVWDRGYQTKFYNKINTFYPDHHKEYCYMKEFDWKIPNTEEFDKYFEFNALDCHNEYRQDELFYRAADRLDPHQPHWGIHKHMHIAENFYGHIISNLN